MNDNTDLMVFIGGTIVTFIFGLGVYAWTRVAFGGFLKSDRDQFKVFETKQNLSRLWTEGLND